MKRNLVTRSLGTMLILRESKDVPSDSEWDECLSKLAQHQPDFVNVKVLVITDGGAPTPPQRKRLSSLLRGHAVRVAVVSESLGFRFVASSVALFLDIASFQTGELEAAFDHLRLDAHQRYAADRAIDEMTVEVSGSKSPPAIKAAPAQPSTAQSRIGPAKNVPSKKDHSSE